MFFALLIEFAVLSGPAKLVRAWPTDHVETFLILTMLDAVIVVLALQLNALAVDTNAVVVTVLVEIASDC